MRKWGLGIWGTDDMGTWGVCSGACHWCVHVTGAVTWVLTNDGGKQLGGGAAGGHEGGSSHIFAQVESLEEKCPQDRARDTTVPPY